jgi:sigma-B regulation protein RsbU (phosphoserine phosphatase)
MVLGALSTEFRSGTGPDDALSRVNRLLCEKSLPAQFVTLFLFMMNKAGEGKFISAAHNPAFLYRGATGKIEPLTSNAYFIGMFDFASWQSRPFQLGDKDILMIYSDGLTDAENPRQEMFGEARLLEVIRQHASSGSQAVEVALLKAVETFTAGTPQTDDITFVIIEKTR